MEKGGYYCKGRRRTRGWIRGGNWIPADALVTDSERTLATRRKNWRREMRVLRVHSFTGRAGHTLTRDGQAGGEEKVAAGKDDERVNE